MRHQMTQIAAAPRRGIALVVLLTMALLLTGCNRAQPLPEGMDAATVIAEAIDVATELGTGDYQAVYDRLRADVAADLTVDDVAALNPQLGDWQGVTGSSVSGQTDQGEYYAMAKLTCQFAEGKRVIFVGFDTQGTLIGLRVAMP